MSVLTKTLTVTALVAGLVVLGFQIYLHRAHSTSGLQPILIPGINEPAEMRVEPIPIPVLTPPERMMVDAVKANKKGGPHALGPAMEPILAKYPDYPDAYVIRLGDLCHGSDRAAITSTASLALKYISHSPMMAESTPGLYSMRAKAEFDSGEASRALDDLEQAIRSNPRKATEFTNSGATAPERTAGACTWTEADMDTLTQGFPNDYRAYMVQGLYYTSFETYQPKLANAAIKAFDKAANLNKQSVLPIYFMGIAVQEAYGFKRFGLPPSQRV